MRRSPGVAGASGHPGRGQGRNGQDADGNLYIDMAAGVAVNAVGRGHPKMLAAVRRQCDLIMHTTDITNPKRIALAKKVSGIMPEGLRRRLPHGRLPGGHGRRRDGHQVLPQAHGPHSDPRLPRRLPRRLDAAPRRMTTGYNYRHGWGPLMPGVQHLPYAYCYRCPFGKDVPRLRRAVRQVRRLRPQRALHRRRRRGRRGHRERSRARAATSPRRRSSSR